ncbi:MAG: NAD(P)/FAD-dependent oxidoreductase [Ruminococcus sp.]|uniref:NAD(P)/FAD-dependent oxidoreductase n=1 Tax=Schaedlerella arabinosiphila TaxID=2044587 RepID=A0A3R8L5K4_9FIRM|nr:NAD(P)/FAD-dependent oxidoreductase [Schaedlerella arabinosiphila]MCI8723954.1 NAD(P)/FAD-dependent oxidoreductase [Ruminococcus sp.]MCI9213242.1 NAD(P)/FAD-dependent oxidoreductase [Ruminococcus sp.]RRK35475.1 NAD(P)/FAD-dependent oxidoreductase [Schaedlerella arabinosiphila]
MGTKNYDAAIIGGGVVGCAVARELSRYDLRICLIEKEKEIGSGMPRAGSAVVHAGFDAVPGTLKARLNVLGNKMMDQLAEELDFDFIRNGAIVLCFDDSDVIRLLELHDRGKMNGVPGLKLLDRKKLGRREPNITKKSPYGLYAPTGGIVCPFEMTAALAESASVNGVEFMRNTEVSEIRKEDGVYCISADGEEIRAKYVVNAAGIYADKIHNMVSARTLHITPRRVEYCLLDQEAGTHVTSAIFQLPGAYGRGILVSPTVQGNLLVGPAADQEEQADTAAGAAGLAEAYGKSLWSVDGIPFHKAAASFSRLEAYEDKDDFILEEAEDAEGFFDAAGMESTGLSSAPAIGAYMAEMVAKKADAAKKEHFRPGRKGFAGFAAAGREEQKEGGGL